MLASYTCFAALTLVVACVPCAVDAKAKTDITNTAGQTAAQLMADNASKFGDSAAQITEKLNGGGGAAAAAPAAAAPAAAAVVPAAHGSGSGSNNE